MSARRVQGDYVCDEQMSNQFDLLDYYIYVRDAEQILYISDVMSKTTSMLLLETLLLRTV